MTVKSSTRQYGIVLFLLNLDPGIAAACRAQQRHSSQLGGPDSVQATLNERRHRWYSACSCPAPTSIQVMGTLQVA